MGLIIENVTCVGFRERRSLRALFDSGASMTMIDSKLAEELGVKHTGRRLSITVLDGDQVEAEEAILRKMIIMDEELHYERVLVFDFHPKLKKKLETLDCDLIIVGVLTVEAAGFILDPSRRELRKVGIIAL